jgi:hypothetical protein
LPWWLFGISDHCSGCSGAVFVAYAAIAYTHGFSLYVCRAFTIGVSVIAKLQMLKFSLFIGFVCEKKFQIQIPLEYLAIRQNVLTQQIICYSAKEFFDF